MAPAGWPDGKSNSAAVHSFAVVVAFVCGGCELSVLSCDQYSPSHNKGTHLHSLSSATYVVLFLLHDRSIPNDYQSASEHYRF